MTFFAHLAVNVRQLTTANHPTQTDHLSLFLFLVLVVYNRLSLPGRRHFSRNLRRFLCLLSVIYLEIFFSVMLNLFSYLSSSLFFFFFFFNWGGGSESTNKGVN